MCPSPSRSSGKIHLVNATHTVSSDKVDRQLPNSRFSILEAKGKKDHYVRSLQSRYSHANCRLRINNTSFSRPASYRRNVSFHHSSCPWPTQVKRESLQDQVSISDFGSYLSIGSLESVIIDNGQVGIPSSPLLPTQPSIVQHSSATMENDPRPRMAKDVSLFWENVAGRASYELGQICEEAFNGSSSSISYANSGCTAGETDDPSISRAIVSSAPGLQYQRIASKPLPRVPFELPSLSGTKDLAASRCELIGHTTKEDPEELFSQDSSVIFQLDRAFRQDGDIQNPSAKTPAQALPSLRKAPSGVPGHLPIIKEEQPVSKYSGEIMHTWQGRPIAPSPPARKSSVAFENRKVTAPSTIRMVSRSSQRDMDAHFVPHDRFSFEGKGTGLGMDVEGDSLKKNTSVNSECLSSPHYSRFADERERIEKISKPRDTKAITKGSENKRWSWFKRKQVDEKVSNYFLEESRPGAPTVVVQEVGESDGSDAPVPGIPIDKRKESLFTKLIKKIPRKEIYSVPAGRAILFPPSCFDSS